MSPFSNASNIVWICLVLGLCAALPGRAQGPDPYTASMANRLDREANLRNSAGLRSSPKALDLWRTFYGDSELDKREDSKVPRDAYIQILGRWADHPGPDRVELLAELEHRLSPTPRCSQSVPTEVIGFLEDELPGSLLPVAALHAGAWQQAIRSRRAVAWTSQTEQIRRLAKRHARSLDRSDQGNLESAVFLTYFAEQIARAGYVDLLDTARSLLDTALEMTTDHGPALHLRAVILEQQGSYGRALKDLKRLHILDPDRDDVLLRSAVQSLRLGKEKDAVPKLAELMDRPAPNEGEEWIRAVAFQEEIRRLMAADKWSEAETTVERSRRLFPRLARFAVLDAAVHRRLSGKSDPEIRQWLDGFSGDHGPTPRFLYIQMPDRDMGENRRLLIQALTDRSRALLQGVSRAKLHDFGRAAQCSGVWKRLRPSPLLAGEPLAGEPTPPAPPAASTPVANDGKKAAAPTLIPATATSAPTSPESPTEKQGFAYTDETTGQTFWVNEVIDLDLKQIYVTPSRLGSRSVRLQTDQISLIDDGREQKIVTFEQGDIPFTSTLLIDASGSMDGSRLQRALAGSQAFVGQMTHLDRARVVVAADRLQGVSSFVSGRADGAERLVEQLKNTQAHGGTALFDHLLLSIDALELEQGRKVVVLLSDGFDLMSAVSASVVRDAVRRSQVQLYWVRLKDPSRPRVTPLTGWRSTSETRQEIAVLEKTVRESGGDVVEIPNLDGVETAFDHILQDLRNQVAIGYYADPSHGDGRWREIEIKAKGLGIRLRHASGYFDSGVP